MTYASQSPDESNAAPRALNAVRAIVRALRVNSRAIESHIGMSLAQVFVLQELEKKPAESLNDLALRTATHQSSVSVVVKRLSDRGLVARVADSTDRRKLRIVVTDAGLEILRHTPETVQSKLLSGLASLEPQDRARLADLLDQWLKTAGIEASAPPMLFEDQAAGA